jgi:hypothetical protein
MMKRITAIVLAVVMMLTVGVIGCPMPVHASTRVLEGTTPAERPEKLSFEIKAEIEVFDGSTLLFSEAPIRTQWGLGNRPYNITHVFPLGTIIAQSWNGQYNLIRATGEENVIKGIFPRNDYTVPVYELILSEAMGVERYGVRIVNVEYGRGLLTILIDGVTEHAINPGVLLPTGPPNKLSFNVKAEIEMFDGSKLLFSEAPIRAQWGIDDYPYEIALVFPLGTIIAQSWNRQYNQIRATGEERIVNRDRPFTDYTVPVYELTLSEAMGVEKYGVRIVNVEYGRGLLTVLIDGVTEYARNPKNSIIYADDIRNLSLTPSSSIHSDDPDIIKLANSIITDASSDLEKARLINAWVAGNVWYDYDIYEGRIERTPEMSGSIYVLEHKRGVCEGYANLAIALLRAVNIPAVYKRGTIISSDGTHAWVEAFVGGRWINMDPTWDSRNRFENGVFGPQQPPGSRYFNISSNQLAATHKTPATIFEFIQQNRFLPTERINNFETDEALIGIWERLGTVQTLDTFTQRNQRNVDIWVDGIISDSRFTSQRLTFVGGGHITNTSRLAGFTSWTNGAINGRRYEIRTVGDNDYLFVRNNTGAPWTVFIRRY